MDIVIFIVLAMVYIFVACACAAYWDSESEGHLGFEAAGCLGAMWPLTLVIYLGAKLGLWLFSRNGKS